MEEKINVAGILKDKPQGTKLYSPIFGKLRYEDLVPDLGEFTIVTSDNTLAKHSFRSDSRYNRHGEPLMLLPSKEMRDWRKFAWKKGDVLIMDGYRVVFDKWLNDDYTRFNAVHLITSIGGYIDKPLQNKYSPISNFITRNWRKMTDAETKIYMDSLERECGGKLNLDTLEIEKTQPEFKIGDILFVKYNNRNIIFILSNINGKFYNHRVRLDSNKVIINYSDSHFQNEGIEFIRYATEEEKQQLFSALEKEGKAWDAEKEQIVDLKPKCEFKPFDKVLGRNEEDDVWEAELFSYYKEESQYPFRCIGFSHKYCIPYNEETAHLLGTTDEWKGGEQ